MDERTDADRLDLVAHVLYGLTQQFAVLVDHHARLAAALEELVAVLHADDIDVAVDLDELVRPEKKN